MIAATLAGSWRVSGGFAEEDGQARGDLRAQKSRSRVLCFLSRRAQAAGSFSSAMLLAAVRTQGNTMLRRGSTQKVE